ncbi:MAG: SDR family NAD(P)-dependent oxidoreductase, partial [Flavitalea sp.]
METIRNKTVLLIGATGTIGSGIAKKLADSGANLYITGQDKNKLDILAEGLKIPADHALQLDLTDESSIQQVMEKFLSNAGAPDI